MRCSTSIKLFSLIFSSVTISCVALPPTPSTPLCVFTNVHTDAKDPKSLGKPLDPMDFYFRCVNSKGTKYNIMATSPSADKIIATPYPDYVELMAYYNKLAEIFKKEFLSKVGR